MKKKLLCLTAALLLLSVPVCAKDTTVTIPAELVSDPDELDFPQAKGQENNPDGSVTYTLTEEQQEEWRKSLKDSFDETIKEILEDNETYPNIENISYNDDMTEFDIEFSSVSNMNFSEMFIGYVPMFTAPVYQQINGVNIADVDYTMKTTDLSTGEETVSSYEDIKQGWEESGFYIIDESDRESGSEPEQQSSNVDNISFDSDSSALIYTGFEFMDYSETEVLAVLKFDFTNKTDTPSDSQTFYNVKAYQNGVELTWYMGIGNEACDNTYKTVLKDTTIEVGFAFMVQDTENPITLYVYEGFYTDSPYQVQEISIK